MDARVFPVVFGLRSAPAWLPGEGKVSAVRPGSFSRGTRLTVTTISADFHRSLRAGEDQSLALFAAIHKIDSEAGIKSFTIVEQAQHDTSGVYIATIISEAVIAPVAMPCVGPFAPVMQVRTAEDGVARIGRQPRRYRIAFHLRQPGRSVRR